MQNESNDNLVNSMNAPNGVCFLKTCTKKAKIAFSPFFMKNPKNCSYRKGV